MSVIRSERPEDIAAVRRVNGEATGQKEEADIVDKLRERSALTISLVAVKDGEVIGHTAFSPVKVESGSSSFQAIALAPMSVLPAYQNTGVGVATGPGWS